MKTTPSQPRSTPTDACPNCGVPWTDHLGIAATCAQSQHWREEASRLAHLLSRYVTDPTFNQKLKAEAVAALEGWRATGKAD